MNGDMELPLQLINQGAVYAVDGGTLDGCEIDLGRGLGVMAHGYADDTQRDMIGLSDAGPRVACYVEGQRFFEVKLLGYLLQAAVDVLCRLTILPLFGTIQTANQGQEIGCTGLSVTVYNLLHLGHEANAHPLASLAAHIDEESPLDIVRAQIGQINGGYTAQVVREEKHVARKGEMGLMGPL